MPDERLDSMQQGIGVPPESPAAQEADAQRRAELARNPSPVPMEGAMGGTSDSERAGDEADMNAALHRGLPDDKTEQSGDTGDNQG